LLQKIGAEQWLREKVSHLDSREKPSIFAQGYYSYRDSAVMPDMISLPRTRFPGASRKPLDSGFRRNDDVWISKKRLLSPESTPSGDIL
jgi:hypothetical protein